MKKSYKILIVAAIFLSASFCLFVSKGECSGEITNQFFPENTYPGEGEFKELEDLNLDMEIVAEGETPGVVVAKAVIVVDIDNSDYWLLAQAVRSEVFELTGVTLPIDDHEAAIDYSQNYIVFGNYATNQFIYDHVYTEYRQNVDISRPGEDNYVRHNLRVGSGENYTTALVIASQSYDKIVDAITDENPGERDSLIELLRRAYDSETNTIILDDDPANVNVNYGYYWYPELENTSMSSSSKSLGEAIGAANRYWLTGQEGWVQVFDEIMHNYGVDAQDPNNFPSGFNAAVGTDNSGALDFNMDSLACIWRGIERSLYFVERRDDRLYITQLLNWMAREFYKCDNSWGALYYAGEDRFPLANHELNAALGFFALGKYFDEDGYDYNQDTAYFYDPESATNPNYANNYAGGWKEDAENAFGVYVGFDYDSTVVPSGYDFDYIGTSYGNDDATGYFLADPSFTRKYCFLRNDSLIFNKYFDSVGGMFDINLEIIVPGTEESRNGEDRGVAEYFCMLSPNSRKRAGFGDTHGYKGPGFLPHDLRFWADKYAEDGGGRFAWMAGENFYNPATSNIEKSFLQFGLRDIPEEKPEDLIGLRIMPLDEPLRLLLNAFDDGVYSYGNGFYYDNPIDEEHVDQTNEILLNKVAFRSDFNEDDQFMAMDCIGQYISHGHDDATSITSFEVNDRIFLASHTYGTGDFYEEIEPGVYEEFTINFRERKNHNVVKVERQIGGEYEAADPNSSTTAALKSSGDFQETGFIDMELPQYGSFTEWGEQLAVGEWAVNLGRTILFKYKDSQQDGFFVVLDEVQPFNSDSYGNYRVSLNWRTVHDGPDLSEFDGEGSNEIRIHQSGEHCVIQTLDDNPAYDIEYDSEHTPVRKGDDWGNYDILSGGPANVGVYLEDEQYHPVHGADTGTLGRVYAEVEDNLSLATDNIIFASLIYPYSGDEYPYPEYQLSTVVEDTVYKVTTDGKDTYLGKIDDGSLKHFGYVQGSPDKYFEVDADLFFIEVEDPEDVRVYFSLVGGSSLSQDQTIPNLFKSNNSVSIEFKILEEEGLIDVNEDNTEISLYAPLEGYVVKTRQLPDGPWVDEGGVWNNCLIKFTIEESGRYEFMTIGPQPHFNNIEDQIFYVGVSNQFTISAQDINGDKLRFISYGYPLNDNAKLIDNNDNTATFIWTPDISDLGSHQVAFYVFDGQYLDSQASTITVSEEGILTGTPNVALGKLYELGRQPSGGYLDEGYVFGQGFQACTLTDGEFASSNSKDDEAWVGWGGTDDIEIAIDLGESTNLVNITGVVVSCLGGSYNMGIFRPETIEVQTAGNDLIYSTVTTVVIEPEGNLPSLVPYTIEIEFDETVEARYVKFILTPRQQSEWGHWTLIDELEVIMNQSPVIDWIPVTTVNVGETAVIPVSAIDPEGDPITLSIDGLGNRALEKIDFIDNGNGTGEFCIEAGQGMAGNTFTFILRADAEGSEDATAPIVIEIPKRPPLAVTKGVKDKSRR